MLDIWILGRPVRRTLTAASLSALLLLGAHSSALADGGNGGNPNNGAGGSFAAPAGGNAGAFGGGGGGGPGGSGGSGNGGLAAGGVAGSPGTDGDSSNGGGGGGGGGNNGIESATPLLNLAPLAGGNGGNGGAATLNGGGGGGGAGGYGAVVNGIGNSFSNGTINGGNGGSGGVGATIGGGGEGGDGGLGVLFTNSASFENSANITAGNGGNGAFSDNFLGGAGGLGGDGVFFTVGTAELNNSAIITGGNGGMGGGSTLGIAATGGSGGRGLHSTATTDIIVNSGTLAGGSGGIGGLANLGGGGGLGGQGGEGYLSTATSLTLENSGAITGGDGGNGGDALGGVQGGAGGAGGNAIQSSATTGNLENSGTITGGTGGTGGSSVATIGGLGGNGGIGVQWSSATIVNAGTITGGNGALGGTGTFNGFEGFGGVGITGDDLTIVNSGSILGGLNGLGFDRANAIVMGGTSNTLEIRAGSTITGTVAANGSSDTLRFGGTTDSNFDVASLGPAVQYLGFETLEKNGTSNWTLEGVNNTYVSDVNILDGVLTVNGSMTNIDAIVTGGTLAGSGTIGSVNVLAGANVAPGDNGIGTLNVAGNYTQAAGSFLNVEITSATNDQVNVGGSAILNGGTVQVTGIGGGFVKGTQYTILTSGNRVGTFAGIVDDIAMLDAMLVYLGNDVLIELFGPPDIDFATFAVTQNELAVANYLDLTGPTATGDYQTVIDNLLTLDVPQLRSAFNQMSGEAHATASQVGVQSTTIMLQQVAQRLRIASNGGGGGPSVNFLAQVSPTASAAASPIQQVSMKPWNEPAPACDACVLSSPQVWNAWSTGYGLGGNAENNGNASGYTYGLGGVLVGADRWIDDQSLVGIFGGYLGSSFTTGTPSATVSNNAGQIGGYFMRTGEIVYVSAIGGFEFDNYDSERNINFNAINRTATADYTGWQGYGYTELGANLGRGNVTLTPFAALQYVHLRQNSITESGAGAINVVSNGIDTDSLRSFLGSRLQYSFEFDNGSKLIPEVQASWLHEYLESDTAINARFGGVGGSGFVAQGLDVGRDWALLGTGITYVISENIRFSANYYLQTNDDMTYHVGAGSLLFNW